MKVGSLVICINDIFSPDQISSIPNRPIRNKIYTIRNIIEYSSNVIGIHLEEILNPELTDREYLTKFEPSFDINRFKELECIPDIEEIIEELLTEKV